MRPERSALDRLSAEERELVEQLLLEGARSAGSGRIVRQPSARTPLSYSQRRLWVVEQLRPGDPAHNLAVTFRVNGELDVDTLAASLTDIAARHEVLRTTFHVADEEPYQQVDPVRPVPVTFIDLRDVSDDQREARSLELADAEARDPFDLSTGPLFRALVLDLGDHDHLLVLAMHHIVSDGWSMGVLYRELAAAYGARKARQPLSLPELPVQYADYVRWQRQLLGAAKDDLVSQWRTQLQGCVAAQLPADSVRPATPSTEGAHELVALDDALLRDLTALAAKEGATRFMALLALFALLMARQSGEDDVVIGIPVAGRQEPEIEPLVGFFVNLVPIRVPVSPEASFRDLLRRVREAVLGAFERQKLPFDLLVDELGIERRLDTHPLFQVVFGAQDALLEPLQLSGLRLEPVHLRATTTRFDVEAHVLEADGRLNLGVIYRTDLFEGTTIRRLLDRYVAVFNACVARPDAAVREVAVLLDGERDQVVRGWNETTTEYPREASVHSLVTRQVEKRPDAVAVIYGAERLTYADLERRANQLAHRLIRTGVGPDVRVGVCLERSPDTIVALLAVLKAGGAYVPLDPAYPPPRLAYLAADSRVGIAISSTKLANLLPSSVGEVVHLDRDRESLAREAITPPGVRVSADDLAYVTYTSGSTGTPKGVEVTHRGVVRLLCDTDYVTLGDDEIFLHLAPLAFDASTFEIWGALLHGARLVLYPDRLPQLDDLAAVLRRERITTLWLTASLYNAVIDQTPAALADVRQLLIGGEALSVAHVRRGLSALTALQIINGYGPTEGTTFTCCHPIAPESVTASTTSIPIGRPIANTRVYVLDRALDPVGIGVPGELYIGGDGVARGYTGAPALTAGRFVPDPFAAGSGARLYRTGDMVRWRADGAIEFLGRRDGQVKVRGHRIELGEIETVITQHPSVRAAAVTVHQTGAGKSLVAYAVAEPDSAFDPASLRAFLKGRLPDYMVPSSFVALVSLPLTANGKIDRAALPAPAPDDAGADKSGLPRTTIEETLATIWSEVLGARRVGIHDNFFDVGGDSILAIQIASRANRAGLRLTPAHFFQHQTIAEQAAIAGRESPGTAEHGPVTGEVPLTPIQRWFFEQRLAAPAHFNQAVLLAVGRPVQASVLQQALDALLRHHDVLRARFNHRDGRWVQQIAPGGGAVPLAVFDTSGVTDEQWRDLIERRCGELQAGLDLTAGPLIRAGLFVDQARAAQRLLLVVHHLVVDGVSWRILLEDLQLAITRLEADGTVPLPAKTTSFKEWAERLGETALDDRHRDFWAAGGGDTPALPVDRTSAPEMNTVGESAVVSVQFSAEETSALLRDVPKTSGARIHEVLLASLAHTVARWSKSPRVAVDVEGHGREEHLVPGANLSRTVGWFTSMYPLLFDVTTIGRPIETLKAVRRQLGSVPDGGVAYGLMRYPAEGDRSPSAPTAPDPEVSFNYLGQFDQAFSESGLFTVASESTGSVVSGLNQRSHLLDFSARVVGGLLHVDWTFCPAIHSRSTIERLAMESTITVKQLTAACRDGEGVRSAADFPHARIDAAQLAMIGKRYAESGIEDIYALTPLQEGMLIHSSATPDSGAFITQIELVAEGPLDTAALKDVWRTLQASHPILRTAFVDIGHGELRQVVASNAPLPWSEHEWPDVPQSEQAARLHELLAGKRQRGFDPASPPLMDLAMVRMGDGRSHFVWTHHHALLDGWSVAVVLNQMLELYAARLNGESLAIGDWPPFRDYIGWLLSRDQAASAAFWRDQLAGFTAPTTLGVDRLAGARVRPARQIDEQEWALDRDATRRLTAVAARCRLTLNTLAQGAWALLLSRYSGERDVVFGTAVAGRPPDLPGADRMIGLFLNGVPMRVAVDGGLRATSWLGTIQARHVAVREHEHAALSEIHEWSDVPRGRPLFETTLAFENYPVAAAMNAAAARMGIVDFKLIAHTSSALHLRVVPGERLRLMLSHDRDRFDGATARAMLGQMAAIFDQIAENPERLVNDISLAIPDAAGRPLAEPAAPLDWRGSAHEQFTSHARRAGDRIAISEGAMELTYAELDRFGDCVANALIAADVATEEVVGVYAHRGTGLVACLLGVLKAGAAFTILDPSYPPDRTRQQLEIADVRIVLHAAGGGSPPEFLGAWSTQTTTRKLIAVDERSLESMPTKPVCAPAGPDRLAYVAYTSGSTGTPKAVLGRHAALARYGSWLQSTFGIGLDDRFSMLTSLSHDPLLRDIFGALELGAVLCVPGAELPSGPGALAKWIAAAHVTVANLTPSTARLMLEGAEGTVLESLRYALFVGEPLRRELTKRLRQLAPSVTCINLYGSTETQQALSYYVVNPASDEEAGRALPVGQGMPGVDLIVARDGGRPAGVGEVGDVWLRSPMLARGYIGDPDLTSARFVDDPFGCGTGRAYRTGDRGRYLPGGDVVLVGRSDDQVKIRGHRVEPGEIEAFLLRQPSVREAAVLPVPDNFGDCSLIAYVAGEVGMADLRLRARQQFPEFMVPSRFVAVDRIPRTASGKTDRNAVAAIDPGDARDHHVAPRNPIESKLAEIWAGLLPVFRIGIHDSFFDIGGHSILAARAIARMRDAFSVDLQVSDLFRHPQIAVMAERIGEALAERDEEMQQLIDEVRGLSPEELNAFLAEVQASSGEGAAG